VELLLDNPMRALLLICSALLFLGLINLPIGYYTFLRIIITIGSVAVIVNEYKGEFTFWVIVFGIIAILFNPLLPIYFNSKEIWMPIDIITGILFGIKAYTLKTK